jgi:alkane 1-monooxygenase
VSSLDLSASGTVSAGSIEAWQDRKRYLWLLGLVVPSLAFLGMGMERLTGDAGWLWIGLIVILGIVPAIDLFTGLDHSNPPDDLIEALEGDRYYRWVTYVYLPIQYAGLVVGMVVIASDRLDTLDKVGLALTLGCVGGIGINTAHELGHKRESVERWLSKIALAQSCYGHFYIEHNRGHHVRVATPGDPASARVGESLYRYWPRTVIGSVQSAWSLERRRLARRQQHPWRIGNDVLNAWLMTVVLWGALVVWLGPSIVPYLLLQALLAVLLLESVNYLEHYGMLRVRVGRGERERWERVDPSHSWNSNNVATNVLLYHLQRHSDHHANPTRRYQALRDYQESPVLPTGYAGMILLALVPPLWRRVMDRRVVAHFDGDIRRANIDPRRRDVVVANWPLVSASRDVGVSDLPSHQDVVAVTSASCPTCGYRYDVEHGEPREGFTAGTAWEAVPDSWCCPDCGVREKQDFVIA